MYSELIELSKVKEKYLKVSKVFAISGMIASVLELYTLAVTLLIVGLVVSIVSVSKENELKKKVNAYVKANKIYDRDYKKATWTIFTKTPWALLKKLPTEEQYKEQLISFYADIEKN